MNGIAILIHLHRVNRITPDLMADRKMPTRATTRLLTTTVRTAMATLRMTTLLPDPLLVARLTADPTGTVIIILILKTPYLVDTETCK